MTYQSQNSTHIATTEGVTTTVIYASSNWEVVQAVTAGETRWMGTPEEEVNGIYDELEETGQYFDPSKSVLYVVQR